MSSDGQTLVLPVAESVDIVLADSILATFITFAAQPRKALAAPREPQADYPATRPTERTTRGVRRAGAPRAQR